MVFSILAGSSAAEQLEWSLDLTGNTAADQAYLSISALSGTSTKWSLFSWIKAPHTGQGGNPAFLESTGSNTDMYSWDNGAFPTYKTNGWWNNTTSGFFNHSNGELGNDTWEAWLFAYDGGETGDNRLRVYRNSTELTYNGAYKSLPTDTSYFLKGSNLNLFNYGRTSATTRWFKGKAAQTCLIDNYQAVPGDVHDSGTPKTNTVLIDLVNANGSGGFFLSYGNSGALGTDSSTHGNDWTVNGSPAQSSDIPT